MGDGRTAQPASSSPAVAASSEAEEIEVLESVDVLPMAPEDHWKVLFDQFDPENTGYISTEHFWSLLQSHGSELDPHKLEVLFALADSNSDGKICYQDFVNLMSNKRSNSFRRAILQGNRRLCSKALLQEAGLSPSQRLIRHIAYETLPREMDRKWYYDSYTGCPPPWFMIAVTLLEVAFFVYYGLALDRFVLQVTHPLYLKNPLIYHPQLRAQAWRYLSYIFMHAGFIGGIRGGHACTCGGLFWRGVCSRFCPSGQYSDVSIEFGRAVWLRFHPSTYPPCPHPSFVAHLSGVLVGITLGVVILRNYEQRLQDQSLWWIFVSIYIFFLLFAVFWNIFAYSLLDMKLPPLP
ncbi:rhomboid-related protein 3 isoform X3 [Rhinatrema bivittatum]|uniref:rhomboid-related protein 3 isoform X3 n=1 Tax=Rhinatrema bivittatum TaxID=194408 RepID=UPI0011263771|nr:rhomboid-related protein 3 isoform X3 [Rhinatrema bivittatum]